MALIVAHRGASAEAPENSLPAFRLAWEQGADAIEADLRLTGDGRVVCIHDEDTGRVAGSRRVVAETALEELQQLDLGKRFGENWTGTRIPALREVLATVPAHGKIFLEVKIGPEILPALYEDLRSSGLQEEQVVLISFHGEVITACKGQSPGTTCLWLTEIRRTIWGRPKPAAVIVLEKLRSLGADGVGARAHRVIDEAYVRGIRSAGFGFHVWTVDDPEDARHFIRMGVRSITSNVPGVLKAGLPGRVHPLSRFPSNRYGLY
ncbi:MAG: glycerophosphodiester phosphodiesterase [Oceanipulchritudo sp.]